MHPQYMEQCTTLEVLNASALSLHSFGVGAITTCVVQDKQAKMRDCCICRHGGRRKIEKPATATRKRREAGAADRNMAGARECTKKRIPMVAASRQLRTAPPGDTGPVVCKAPLDLGGPV